MKVLKYCLDEFKCENLKTIGATNCQYFKCYHPNIGVVFIKRGEKVKNEINFYKKNNISSILPIIGELNEGGIILPYADNPTYGFDLIDRLWNEKIEIDCFLREHHKILELIKNFYMETSYDNNPFVCENHESAMFENRAKERYYELLNIKNQKIAFRDQNIKLEIFLKQSIITDNKAPSLGEMIENIFSDFKKTYPWKPRTIHGDFQTSNIVFHNNKIYLSDISDIRYNDDISWDLAKSLNYKYLGRNFS